MDRTANQIGEFVAGVSYASLPPEAVDAAKRHLLDGLGCAIGGLSSPPVATALKVAQRVRSSPGSRLFSNGAASSVEMAAFVNTVALRYLDYNDTYISKSGLHPSDVIPALVAIGESRNASGADLGAAIVAAYDILGAFADATDIRERGWDQGILISIAVAAAGTRLAGGRAGQIAHAASIAAVSDVPTRQTRVGELAMWKGCATAAAARNGIFAAELALEGMTAPAAAFDGYHGLAEQVTGPISLVLPATPGTALAATSLKFHPSEYHSQAPLDLLARLRKSVSVDEIEAIEIETYWVVVDEISEPAKWTPSSRETADHSLPFLTATMLVFGEVWTDSYSAERLRDPALLSLMSRITVSENAELTAAYPERWITQYRIRLKNGQVVEGRTEAPKGSPKNPMSHDDVMHKFTRLWCSHRTAETAQATAQAVTELENLRVPELVDRIVP